MFSSRTGRSLLLFVAAASIVSVTVSVPSPIQQAVADVNPCEPWPICRINHIVIIDQENRSFDHYFGTYESPSGEPVNGLPRRQNGSFKVCVPHPVMKRCVPPYHSKNLFNEGGPHSYPASLEDVNGGKMDGFIRTALWAPRTAKCVRDWKLKVCAKLTGPQNQPDVMGYHTDREIPNYWAYADYGVLQDNLFAPVDSWSLPSHMYLVSAWAATCKDPHDANTCKSDPRVHNAWNYPWADITFLLRNAGVTWGYFVGNTTDLDCFKRPCENQTSNSSTPEGWMPMRWFQSVNQANNDGVRHTSDFFDAVAGGTLPQVSWLIPPAKWSEHPGHSAIRPGERYVTKVVNALGASPLWADSAVFITWDDWGGFYDHVEPVIVDQMGYGIRVPGMMISPYAKTSYVDHQMLSSDAYLKFIEDRFLGGQRLDPATDGWFDPRPTVREAIAGLGDLSTEFDFTQPPRPAPILELPPLGKWGKWPQRYKAFGPDPIWGGRP